MMGTLIRYALGIGGGAMIGGGVEAWIGASVLDYRWWLISMPAIFVWCFLVSLALPRRRPV